MKTLTPLAEIHVPVPLPDERYSCLTPAQWACMGALGVGIWLLRRPSPVLEFTGPPPPAPEPPAPDPVRG